MLLRQSYNLISPSLCFSTPSSVRPSSIAHRSRWVSSQVLVLQRHAGHARTERFPDGGHLVQPIVVRSTPAGWCWSLVLDVSVVNSRFVWATSLACYCCMISLVAHCLTLTLVTLQFVTVTAGADGE